MILKRLQLEYFKQYSQLNIEFKEGLVGIVGRNGAGKSTLFEAVLLCLFGKTSSDKAFYKSSWAPEKTHTILELLFELNQKVYKVRREFRGKAMQHQAYLYDQNEQLLASSAGPVNEAVAQLIGLDRDAFTRSIFSGQKELGIISNTRGEERKRMVRRMVGLDKLDKIQQLVRDDRNSKKKEIQGQEALLLSEEDLEGLQKQVKQLNKEIAQTQKEFERKQNAFNKENEKYLKVKQAFDQLNELYKTHNGLQIELAKWEDALQNLSLRQTEIKAEIKELKTAQKAAKALGPKVKKYQQVRQQLVQLEKDRAQYEQLQQLNVQQENIAKQLVKEQTQIAAAAPLLAQGKELNSALETAQQALAEFKNEQQKVEEKAAALEKQIGGVESRIKERQDQLKQIQSLGKDAQCPTCLQPLINSYDQTLQRLQKEIGAYEQQELTALKEQQGAAATQLATAKKQINDQQASTTELSSKRDVLREQYRQLKKGEAEIEQLKQRSEQLQQQQQLLQKNSFDPKQFAAVKEERDQLEPHFLEFTKLEKQVERLPDQEVHLKANIERTKTGEAGIKEKKAAIKALQFSLPKFEETKAKMDQLEDLKEAAQEVVRQQTELLNQQKQTQTARQRDLDNHQRIAEQIGSNRSALQELELLDKLFQEFKNQMLVRIRPMIKQTAGRLFEQITRGRYEGMEVDDNFEFHIFENGQSYPIHRFSGGEIDLANLCLRIGISQAIAELSGSEVGLNFLAFDEIFGSQDDERRFEILLALDHLKEQYRQIYIISHIDTIKEHFPNILQVRQGADGSQAEWH